MALDYLLAVLRDHIEDSQHPDCLEEDDDIDERSPENADCLRFKDDWQQKSK